MARSLSGEGNCSEDIVASRLIVDGTNCYGTRVKSIFN